MGCHRSPFAVVKKWRFFPGSKGDGPASSRIPYLEALDGAKTAWAGLGSGAGIPPPSLY
jgi:hypothetical protein